MSLRTGLLLSLAVATGALLPAPGHAATAPPSAASCAALGSLPLPSAAMLVAQWNAATPDAPAHCELIGALDARTGIDGRPYAIRYHLRLPERWNRRFFFQGGSGTDGYLGSANGARLVEGYAVVATDSGHDDAVDADPSAGGSAAFGADPQARIDYGYRALGRVTETAKTLIRSFYGRKPRHSYFVGCSNGGRQGMVASERFPQHFDGIVAGDPGFDLPRAALAEAWNEQALAPLATRLSSNGQPYLPDTFSDTDLTLVATAILDACDALDGLSDGIVDDHAACTSALVHPRLDAIQCAGAKTPTCLSAAQVVALKRIYAAPHTADGTPLYSDWQWDPGLTGNLAFRAWLLGSPVADGQPLLNNALNLTLGGGVLPLLFVTPPVILPATALEDYVFHFDFEADAAKIDAVAAPFTESASQYMTARSTDRAAFKRRGGKLILFHGNADAVFSPHDTIDWYQRMSAATRGATRFARLFVVPGLGHCYGGSGTTSFDPFPALVAWVERGVAPKQLVATAPPGTPWPGRTRPLCPYPLQARYRGKGSMEDAESFRCRRPTNP